MRFKLFIIDSNGSGGDLGFWRWNLGKEGEEEVFQMIAFKSFYWKKSHIRGHVTHSVKNFTNVNEKN